MRIGQIEMTTELIRDALFLPDSYEILDIRKGPGDVGWFSVIFSSPEIPDTIEGYRYIPIYAAHYEKRDDGKVRFILGAPYDAEME